MAAIAQHGEQPLEETQRAVVVEVAADAGDLPHRRGGDRLLPAKPGDQRLGGGGVTGFGRLAVAAQRGGEGVRGAGEIGEALLHQRVYSASKPFGVVLGDLSGAQDLLFEGVEPQVDDGAQRTGGVTGGGEPLGEAPVDGFEPVQWRFGLGDLDLGDGQPGAFGALPQPAGEERFAGAVLAADGAERRTALADGGDLAVQRPLEPVQ